MTSVAHAILELQRTIFARLAELERTSPAEVDLIVGEMVRHLRSWRPVAIAPLGTLAAPSEPPSDPRK